MSLDDLEARYRRLLSGQFDPPDPSLCDSCVYAGTIPGGSASYGGKVYAQRYCGALHIAIHGGGKQECEHYLNEETATI